MQLSSALAKSTHTYAYTLRLHVTAYRTHTHGSHLHPNTNSSYLLLHHMPRDGQPEAPACAAWAHGGCGAAPPCLRPNKRQCLLRSRARNSLGKLQVVVCAGHAHGIRVHACVHPRACLRGEHAGCRGKGWRWAAVAIPGQETGRGGRSLTNEWRV